MKPLVFHDFKPQANVIVYTKNGPTYSSEIMADMLAFTVVRSTDGSPGSFSLTLTARTDANGSWGNKISPLDYVEIYAANSYPPKIRMRGFVENSIQNFVIGPDGGPTRAITINGKDFTKMFTMNQIQYIWQNDPSAVLNMAWGLSYNYGLPSNISTAQDFAFVLRDQIFQNFMLAYQDQNDIILPFPSFDITIPENYKIPYLTVQPYTGNFWNLFTYFNSPPIGESFIYDDVDGPHVVMRIAPFYDSYHKIISPAVEPQLPPIQLGFDLIVSQDLGKSDNEVYNFFFVYSDAATVGQITQFYFVNGGTNPLQNAASQSTFGFRPLMVDSPWVTLLAQASDADSKPFDLDGAAELCAYISAAYDHNEKLISGSITTHGSEQLIPGRYLEIPEESLSFYIEQVQEEFRFVGSDNPSWVATVALTRGQTIK